MEVRFTQRVLDDINHLERYIAQQGYPDTAVAYTNRIIDFTRNLKLFPEKFTLCKYPAFSKKGFRCAIIDNHIIVYRITDNAIEVLRLIHGKRLSY